MVVNGSSPNRVLYDDRVNRALLVFLLAAAVVGTGLLARSMLGAGGAGRQTREERERADVLPPRDPPAKPVPEDPARGAPEDRGFEVIGEVRDTGGHKLGGATVRADQAETRTSDRGVYTLQMPLPMMTFTVWADGYLPAIERFICEGDRGPWRRDFVLEPAAMVEGGVVDPAGVPVARAQVYLISREHDLLDRTHVGNLAITDAQGRFRFPGVAAGTMDLGVRADGFLPAIVLDVEVPVSGRVERRVRLERGRTIEVAVRNGTEATLVFAADSRLRGELLPPGGITALADALVGRRLVSLPVVTGRDKLVGVGPGRADVEARDPDRITEDGLGRLFDTANAQLQLTLVGKARVKVQAVDVFSRKGLVPVIHRMSGEPPHRVPVRFEDPFATVPVDTRAHTLHFDVEGYESASLPLPPRREDWPETFLVEMHPLADGETGAFHIILDPKFAGRVALIGRNAEGRRVWAKHLEELTRTERWTVSEVPFGEYVVTVLATGKIPVVLPRVVVAQGLHERHRVRLDAGGGLQMKVTDKDGKLLEKVHVLLKDGADTRIDIHVMTHVSEDRAFLSINYLPSAATASADSGLAPGTYTLTAYKDGYEPATREFTINGAEVAAVDLTLVRR